MIIFLLCVFIMVYYIGNEMVLQQWMVVCNDLIKWVVDLYFEYFIGVCQLLQLQGVLIVNLVVELECCVNELGFVGCNFNFDFFGGYWILVSLIDYSWYLLYEKMVELDVFVMVYVLGFCNYNFYVIGVYYLNVDIIVFMQFLQGNLFKDFFELWFIIFYGGGVVLYYWGCFCGLVDMFK